MGCKQSAATDEGPNSSRKPSDGASNPSRRRVSAPVQVVSGDGSGSDDEILVSLPSQPNSQPGSANNSSSYRRLGRQLSAQSAAGGSDRNSGSPNRSFRDLTGVYDLEDVEVALTNGSQRDGGDERSPLSRRGSEFVPNTSLFEPAGPPAIRVIIQRNAQSILGKGGYGTVYRAYNKDTHESLAVKEVDFDESNVSLVRQLRTEFEVLRQLNHPHIVRVFHFALEGRKKARIFMELMEGGSVRSLMKRSGGRLDEATARRAMFEALLGMEYLHSQGLLHRDLKPDNLLVDAHGTVKLSDFGTCRETLHAATGTTTMVVGTVSYMAPEVTVQARFSQGSDIWAWAATFGELLSGRMPWSEVPERQAIQLIFHIGAGRPPDHHPRIPTELCTVECAALLKQCFAFNPKERPTARQLLDSPYFEAEMYADDDLPPRSRSVSPPGSTQQPHADYVPPNAREIGEGTPRAPDGESDDFEEISVDNSSARPSPGESPEHLHLPSPPQPDTKPTPGVSNPSGNAAGGYPVRPRPPATVPLPPSRPPSKLR